MSGRRKLDPFTIAAPIVSLIAFIGIVAPDQLAATATFTTTAVLNLFDRVLVLIVSTLLVVFVWLGLGPYGGITLGKANERPEFGRLPWFAMLFAAGMGAGLLFYGVAEPLTHYTIAPNRPSSDVDAARWAMVLTVFHWGFHAWTLYGMSALAIAYFGFRLSCPYLPGASLRRAFGDRRVAWLAFAANLTAIVAVAFGLAGSVALGVSQLNGGLGLVFGTPAGSKFVSSGVLLVLAACYMTSAAAGLHKGIKWLSNLNMLLVALLICIHLRHRPDRVSGQEFRDDLCRLSDGASRVGLGALSGLT